MPLVDLAIVKDHRRLGSDEMDDVLLGILRDAAETQIVQYLDRPVHPAGTTLPGVGDDGYDSTAIVASADIVAAILLMTGRMYETREPSGSGDAVMPAEVRALLAPYRVWRMEDEDA